MPDDPLSNPNSEYRLPSCIDDIMAALGITDENIDNIEKEQEEQDRQAYKKWRKFVKTFKAKRNINSTLKTHKSN